MDEEFKKAAEEASFKEYAGNSYYRIEREDAFEDGAQWAYTYLTKKHEEEMVPLQEFITQIARRECDVTEPSDVGHCDHCNAMGLVNWDMEEAHRARNTERGE